jgi:hypothetical protein
MTALPPDSADRCPCGVYRIDDETRSRILGDATMWSGCHLAVIDGAAASSRAGFFAEAARVLRFPDYFGHNWDAVYDLLTDPGWFPPGGLAIMVDGCDGLATREPEQWKIALKVLHEACAFWQPLGVPLYILLYGDRVQDAGVAELPGDCLASVFTVAAQGRS